MALLATLLQLAGLLGFTWWLLAQYKHPHVAPVVLGAVFVSWALGFLALLLLPVDLAENGLRAALGVSSSVASGGNSSASANATVSLQSAGAPPEDHVRFLGAWQALYWLTFALGWAVLPFLAEFCQNGEFQLDRRVLSSLRHLVLHWRILAAACGVVVVYLLFVGHFSLFGLRGLAMASANAYGLLWLIALLGFGLVDVPRSLWTLRSPANRLKELHFRAVQVHGERMEAIASHEDVIGAVHDCYARMLHAEGVSIILTSDMQFIKTCLLRVKELAEHREGSTRLGLAGSEPTSSSWRRRATRDDRRVAARRVSAATGSPFASSLRTPTLREVVELHRRVLQADAERRRSELAWVELCVLADGLHDRVADRELPPTSLFPETSLLNDARNVAMAVQRRLGRLALEPLAICCATVSGAASLCIVWSELAMGVTMGNSTSLFRAFASAWGANASELLALAVLLYMAACACASLEKLRAFGRFGLRRPHASTDQSLLAAAIVQCRLQFALGHNFLLLLGDRALSNRTALATLLDDMRVVHMLGRGFAVFAPTLVALVAGVALSDSYALVLHRLGLEPSEQLALGSAAHDARVAEGEALVQRGRARYRRTVLRRRRCSASSGWYDGVATASADGALPLLDDGGGGSSSDDDTFEQLQLRGDAVRGGGGGDEGGSRVFA